MAPLRSTASPFANWSRREWLVFLALGAVWAILAGVVAVAIGDSWTLALLAAAAWAGGVFSGILVQRLGLTGHYPRRDLG